MFHVLTAVAEFEHGTRAERQAEGIRKAKEPGVCFGRRSTITKQQRADIRAKRATGVLIKDLKRQYGLSESSIYRILAARPGSERRFDPALAFALGLGFSG